MKNPLQILTANWLEIITSRDAKSACFQGSQTSCTEVISGVFLPKFGRKRSHHVMDASCWFMFIGFFSPELWTNGRFWCCFLSWKPPSAPPSSRALPRAHRFWGAPPQASSGAILGFPISSQSPGPGSSLYTIIQNAKTAIQTACQKLGFGPSAQNRKRNRSGRKPHPENRKVTQKLNFPSISNFRRYFSYFLGGTSFRTYFVSYSGLKAKNLFSSRPSGSQHQDYEIDSPRILLGALKKKTEKKTRG